MIALLGATGYIGSAFAEELERRGESVAALSRKEVDYARAAEFSSWLAANRPAFVINAAGYAGKPNVDACEDARGDTLRGNVVFPAMVAHACASLGIPWGYVSSGCIYAGAHVRIDGQWRVEKDLTRPGLLRLAEDSPENIRGFAETDAPNFTFDDLPCSFYSGSKALGEAAIEGVGQGYLWRLRIPFDEFDGARNYLSKVQRYPKVYDNFNSVSHRLDFVRACLDLGRLRAPFGIYNVTNPGFVSTREVVKLIEEILQPDRPFEFWKSDAEFYSQAARAPRSNCVMDASKLLAAGVQIRPVRQALADALRRWQPETALA